MRTVIVENQTDPKLSTLGKNDEDLDETEHLEMKYSVKDIPQSRYGDINLKKYSSFKSSRVGLKLQNQEALAINQLKHWVSHVSVELNMLNIELLVDVANFLHKFFIYGDKHQREQSFSKVFNLIMLPYFKNDQDVLDAMKTSVEYRIVKSTLLSRRVSKLKNSFFFVLEILLKNSVKV